MKKIQIIPAILEKEFKSAQKKIKLLEPYFRIAQIDVADGKFVKNKTILSISKFSELKTSMKFELHLMLANPLEFLKNKNLTKVKRIVIHQEAVDNLGKSIKNLQIYKKQIGIALNPKTSIRQVENYIEEIDLILIMGVNPGWKGQDFIPSVLGKAKRLRQDFPNLDIGLDGGLTPEFVPRIVRAGVNVLYSGGYIFSQGSIEEARDKMLGLS